MEIAALPATASQAGLYPGHQTTSITRPFWEAAAAVAIKGFMDHLKSSPQTELLFMGIVDDLLELLLLQTERESLWGLNSCWQADQKRLVKYHQP